MSEQDRGLAPVPTLLPKPTRPLPAHARDPRLVGEAHASKVEVPREDVFDLIEQVKRLSPCHRDPHRFHQRKDEIVSLLYRIATAS